MGGYRYRSTLDWTLSKRNVLDLSINMRKVRDPSNSDDKGVIVIVDKLNGSLLRSIYI